MKLLILFLSLTLCAKTKMTKDEYADYKSLQEDEKEGDIEDAALVQINTDIGVPDIIYKLNDDSTRASILYHGNALLHRVTEVQTFEFQYAYKFSHYWAEIIANTTIGTFGSMSENHAAPILIDTAQSEERHHQRSQDSKLTVVQLGLGVSLRRRFPQTLIRSHHIFQTLAAYLTVQSAQDELRGLAYQGPGVRADWGIHKRVTRKTHLGVKLSYQYSSVKRSESYANESGHDRRLPLSWVSLAIDYTFYP